MVQLLGILSRYAPEYQGPQLPKAFDSSLPSKHGAPHGTGITGSQGVPSRGGDWATVRYSRVIREVPPAVPTADAETCSKMLTIFLVGTVGHHEPQKHEQQEGIT